MDERIGHYKIVSELGRGGMGVVYKAHEESLNRFVALKVLGEHLTEDESYVERFVREAQSAAKLNHPNIVQIYSISKDGNRHFFVMEYVSGTSVQRLIRNQGRIEPVTAARIILQAAAGLQAAHELGVIHRDIKPANLMVTEKGLVKIADFGLALLTENATRLTATGMFMGTPGYLSPEQCLDSGLDHRSDIYSLGVTFFEMLAGSMPFKATSPLALIRQIIEVEPPDIRELNPVVDGGLRTILQKMMAKDRDQRYSSCDALAQDLEGWLASQGAQRTDPAMVAKAVSSGSGAAAASDRPAALHSDPTVVMESGEAAAAGTAPLPPSVTAPQPPPPASPTAPVSPPPAPAATPPAAATAAPPPPQPAPVPAPQPVAPVEATTAGARKGGNRFALVAILVVLLGLAGLAAGSFYAWRSGVFASLIGGGGEEPLKVTDADIGELGGGGSQTPPGPESERATQLEATGASGAAAEASSSSAEATQSGSSALQTTGQSQSATPAGQGPSGSASTSREPATTAPRRGSDRQNTAPTHDRPVSTSQSAPPTAPRPTATAILALGDPTLSEAAATYLESRLASSGIEVVDARSLSGLPLDGEPEAAAAAMSDVARWLVVVRGEYQSQREVRYLGRYDTVFQGRLFVRLIDVGTRQATRPLVNEGLEYTHLNADDKVRDLLRPISSRIVDTVRPD